MLQCHLKVLNLASKFESRPYRNGFSYDDDRNRDRDILICDACSIIDSISVRGLMGGCGMNSHMHSTRLNARLT